MKYRSICYTVYIVFRSLHITNLILFAFFCCIFSEEKVYSVLFVRFQFVFSLIFRAKYIEYRLLIDSRFRNSMIFQIEKYTEYLFFESKV